MDGAVNIFSTVSLWNLVGVVARELEYREIIELIREIDSEVADSEFTEMLINLAAELKAELESDR